MVVMVPVTFDRITVTPGRCDGKPCIRGLRIPVQLILRLLSSGKTPVAIIADYPELEEADIKQAMEYAASVSLHVGRSDHNSTEGSTRACIQRAFPNCYAVCGRCRVTRCAAPHRANRTSLANRHPWAARFAVEQMDRLALFYVLALVNDPDLAVSPGLGPRHFRHILAH